MTTKTYWFARRFPVGHPSNAMAPVHWKGWAVALGFLGGMLLSGLVWLMLAASGRMALGVAVFAIGSAVSGAAFIWIALRTHDSTHTVADYRAGRAP